MARGVRRTGGGLLASGRDKALVSVTAVLAVLAVVGVFLAPRLFGGPSDPGCQAYANTALIAYDKTVTDLNAGAPRKALHADMAMAVSDLSAAAARTQSPTATSAISGLLRQLKTIRTDLAHGSVPGSAVSALNAASSAADHAC